MSSIQFNAILLISLAALGCSTSTKVPQQQIVLSTKGPISIDARTIGGDVTITADDSIHGTVVTVQRRILQELQIEDLMQWITLEADVVNTNIGQKVVVKTSASHNELNLMRADVSISTNSIEDVQVQTSTGDVTLLGISGSLDIRTSDGDILVATNNPMVKTVSIENHRGNIIFRVSELSTGNIDISAIGGDARFDAISGHASVLSNTSKGHVMAVLNDGKNVVNLRTVDGNASFEVVKNPMANRISWNFDWLPF
ncbi:MAG: DUF4097 family beta strand repeat protein [Phycisphaerae bacterium]|jgi:hypothetical protein|nr:DUF4097 family beta strand repeat protein [Phycisphaerae bacterium]